MNVHQCFTGSLKKVVVTALIVIPGLFMSSLANADHPGGSPLFLQPLENNQIFYNNFEAVFDSAGDYIEPNTQDLQVGDHIVAILNVQNIEVNSQTHFFAAANDQFTGIVAQQIVFIFPSGGDPFPAAQQAEPHVVFGPPQVTTFCRGADCFSTGLSGNEVMALYRDTTTAFESNGSLADDVGKATDGELWATFGLSAADTYLYAHTDGLFPEPDESYYGLNIIINNTGFEFFDINDLNEFELGTFLSFTSLVGTSELETNINAIPGIGDSPWAIASNDPATLRPFELVEGDACRFTGGGVDTLQVDLGTVSVQVPVWNGVFEQNESLVPDGVNRYQFGGQAGANTGAQPQPKGEWTHHQQTGPSGSFTFHGGTASAPEGTEIDEIRCSDPGFCFPARPAPTKQLDFDGIGTFKNIGKGKKKPVWNIPPNLAKVTAEGRGNKAFNGTFHWFEVNIDDLGEPGNEGNNSGKNINPDEFPNLCPPDGFGEKGSIELANCDCPDFYRITIYNGVNADTLVKNPDGSINPADLPHGPGDVLYEAYGYPDGGNLQIHPPTGFDQKLLP